MDINRITHRITTEEFILNAKKIHGDRYDYSHAVYVNNQTKVKIKCEEHGFFEQTPNNHVSKGQNCPKCMPMHFDRLTTEQFIINARMVHGDRYDYSQVVYINSKTDVKIICKEHGIFEQTPNNHVDKGQFCPKCSVKYKDTNMFIQESIEVHGDRYDYSLVNYVNANTEVKIICKEHGMFEQEPRSHTSGCGCPKCSPKYMDTAKFIKQATKLHKNKYDYPLVNYVNANTEVKIICKKHGIFEQKALYHLVGYGCSKCSCSLGETKTSCVLDSMNIRHIHRFTFEDCRNIFPLPFDFYLPDINICIEYNGQQHYFPIEHWGGMEQLKLQQFRDNIKKEYCLKHGIKLIIIRYDEDIKTKLLECL